MSKHTPGPWAWWPDCCRIGGMVTAETGQHVAAPIHFEHDKELSRANARLITAAPDLKSVAEDDADAWDQVAAYAEECGETDGPINQIIAIAEIQAEKARVAIAKADGE